MLNKVNFVLFKGLHTCLLEIIVFQRIRALTTTTTMNSETRISPSELAEALAEGCQVGTRRGDTGEEKAGKAASKTPPVNALILQQMLASAQNRLRALELELKEANRKLLLEQNKSAGLIVASSMGTPCSPTTPPPVPVQQFPVVVRAIVEVVCKGVYAYDSVTSQCEIRGTWYDKKAVDSTLPKHLNFSYSGKSKFPTIARGSFEEAGAGRTVVPEKNVHLEFKQNSRHQSLFHISGRGRNCLGKFTLKGSLNLSEGQNKGFVVLRKRYVITM